MTMLARAKLLRRAAVIGSISSLALVLGVRGSSSADLENAAFAQKADVALPADVMESASVYAGYVERAAAINPHFTDGKSVAASLKTGETYEARQMQRGMAAYGAVVALEDQAFVSAVRVFAANPAQRAQIIAWIRDNPAYAEGFRGADEAAGLVMDALNGQGRRVLDAGVKVKQAAYDVQHEKWSKAEVPGRPARLALAKSLSSTPVPSEPEDRARMQLASSGAARLTLSARPTAPPYTSTVERALAIAALAVLGGANGEQIDAVLARPEEGDCLTMAKLNLYQCLAVSKPHYEDVFCLGQHALMDTGQCIVKSSGASAPAMSPLPARLADGR
jgi:hypothetical protein